MVNYTGQAEPIILRQQLKDNRVEVDHTATLSCQLRIQSGTWMHPSIAFYILPE